MQARDPAPPSCPSTLPKIEMAKLCPVDGPSHHQQGAYFADRGFNSIFTEVRDGRLRPNKENAQFADDLTLLCDSIHERYGGLQLTNSISCA